MRQTCLGISDSSTTVDFSTDRLSATDPGHRQTGSEAGCGGAELANPPVAAAGSADLPPGSVPDQILGEARLDKVLEEARLATGATGAAIAVVRGSEMVCCATAGPDAPDLGTHLDPGTGFSGCCIRTRELQQCSDTETDPRVDLGACRRLGVRSIVILPLMDADELFGVLEILSSRPDAFGEGDVCRLKILANRIVESKLPRWKANATAPRKDPAVEPTQADLRAREVFVASPQPGTRRRSYWMAIQTAAVVALAVLLGWMLGRAGWEMAVERAESQISRSQEEARPAAQVAPDPLPTSSSVDQSTSAQSETKSLSENEAGQLQTGWTRKSDSATVPARLSPKTAGSYVLKRVKPDYPEEARQQRIQGRVVMNVLVGTDGLVRELVVASGNPQLVQSAANAVRQWRFKPHRLKGQPVEFETRITVTFALT